MSVSIGGQDQKGSKTVSIGAVADLVIGSVNATEFGQYYDHLDISVELVSGTIQERLFESRSMLENPCGCPYLHLCICARSRAHSSVCVCALHDVYLCVEGGPFLDASTSKSTPPLTSCCHCLTINVMPS